MSQAPTSWTRQTRRKQQQSSQIKPLSLRMLRAMTSKCLMAKQMLTLIISSVRRTISVTTRAMCLPSTWVPRRYGASIIRQRHMARARQTKREEPITCRHRPIIHKIQVTMASITMLLVRLLPRQQSMHILKALEIRLNLPMLLLIRWHIPLERLLLRQM